MSSVADPSFRNLCCYGAGIAGNAFAFVLFISPLPTFRRIVRNGSTEQFSAMPYIYSLLNCLICMWYGLPFISYGVVLVATVNSIGAAFQLAYTAVFIAFADAKERFKVSGLLAAVFVVFGLIMYVSLALLDHKTRQTFVGYLSVASLIFMFASPLSIIVSSYKLNTIILHVLICCDLTTFLLGHSDDPYSLFSSTLAWQNLVIRTKSVEYMPFYLSLSMFLMSVSFFVYGVLLHDFFIYIPNGIGTILGIIQLLLYAYFKKGSGEEARLPLLVTHT
ncbi:Bidirectional sugar transporter SWEET2a [Dichanthelium oligosanthes]|uniref:Bidirectional sugar transporter SWEET n=1 Tax=Dichanthelium oligosanthes TaxID=888268 RepID=A0A1E5VXA3_9POAL|nr:Bidirectional sugar transporter SWEET2a [Dichanthelium oligosanthes]